MYWPQAIMCFYLGVSMKNSIKHMYHFHKNTIRKLIFIALIISFGIQILVAGKIDKKEYQELIAQCQAIRARILRENNFEAIKQEALRRFEQETVPSLAERFTSLGGHGNRNSLSSGTFTSQLGSARMGLESNLNVLQAEHNIRLNTLTINTIAAFLNILNTPTSISLLAEFIANGFNF